MITEWLASVLILIGSLFSSLGAVGVLRMPDVYMRIQAATKSATLGVSCLVLAAAVLFDSFGASARAILVVAFLMLTAPIAAHIIGRAAYAVGTPLWDRTVIDELRDPQE